jgi:hypothetical protein
VDRFVSYDAARTWLRSIGGYVGPVERRDARNSVTVFGDHGLTCTSAFDSGYREAVRLEVLQAARGPVRGVGE